MSNHHDGHNVGEVNLFAARARVTLNEGWTAVRQFWKGYLLSPTGC
jgi:hypothetical protein